MAIGFPHVNYEKVHLTLNILKVSGGQSIDFQNSKSPVTSQSTGAQKTATIIQPAHGGQQQFIVTCKHNLILF